MAKKPKVEVKPPSNSPSQQEQRSESWKRFWTSVFSLGSFLAGAMAGYVFKTAERKFAQQGEKMVVRVIRFFQRRQDDGVQADWENDFPDRSSYRNYAPFGSAVGPGGRPDFPGEEWPDEDQI